ncbi:hypothetical protein JCM2811A_11570 [Methylorubrum rhodinum]
MGSRIIVERRFHGRNLCVRPGLPGGILQGIRGRHKAPEAISVPPLDPGDDVLRVSVRHPLAENRLHARALVTYAPDRYRLFVVECPHPGLCDPGPHPAGGDEVHCPVKGTSRAWE